jgi:RNA polymerase-binding transcription factor DksA
MNLKDILLQKRTELQRALHKDVDYWCSNDSEEEDVTVMVLAQAESDEITRINAVLQKINNGSYGICEDCEKPISKPRLEALPYVTRCIGCQRDMEKGQVEHHDEWERLGEILGANDE